MIKISAVIIAFNEERDIGRCLESLQGIADETIVLDSFSTDQTPMICHSMGVRFEQHVFDGYVSQKNRALQLATYDYVLSLDADEALSETMKPEILKVKQNWDCDGYIFNRRNSYCGHWMRFTSWYPDQKLRLFDRRKAHWVGLDPHDYIRMDEGCATRHLKGDLLHWAIHTEQEEEAKTEQFARIAAKYYFNQGIKSRWTTAIAHCVWRWFNEYCIRLGILDGKSGWQVAGYSALYVWKKYSYLRQLYGDQSKQEL